MLFRSQGLMTRNERRLEAWMAAASSSDDSLLADVRAALDDDLDSPRAVSLIDEAAARGIGVRASAELLGVLMP